MLKRNILIQGNTSVFEKNWQEKIMKIIEKITWGKRE
jgi:CO dehydrogenase/acetyl-CoA synthase epsilon subunit